MKEPQSTGGCELSSGCWNQTPVLWSASSTQILGSLFSKNLNEVEKNETLQALDLLHLFMGVYVCGTVSEALVEMVLSFHGGSPRNPLRLPVLSADACAS